MRIRSLIPVLGLLALAACGTEPGTEPAAPPPSLTVVPGTPLDLGATTLTGTFIDHVGATHTFRLKLDMVNYQNGNSHKVWIKPEDYQLDKGTWTGLVPSCVSVYGHNTFSPGVRGISSGVAPSVTCTWKATYGASPSGQVTLVPGGSLTQPLPIWRSFQPKGKTISATFEAPVGSGNFLTSTLKLDVVDYRNGTSHKAYMMPNGYQFTTTGAVPMGWRFLSCDKFGVENGNPGSSGAKLVSAGAAPIVTCNWKIGNGTQPPQNYGTVTLQ